MKNRERNKRKRKQEQNAKDTAIGCASLFIIAVCLSIINLAAEAFNVEPSFFIALAAISTVLIIVALYGIRILKKFIISKRNKARREKIGNIRFAIERGEYINMSGESYENYVASRLKEMRYHSIEMTRTTGDHGADIIAYAPDGVKCAIQCKYYSKPVGNKAVQEALAGMIFYRCDRAIVITNNSFTKQAIEDANRIGVDLFSKF